MKNLNLNFFELHSLIKVITGVNTLSNEMLLSKDDKLKGLLNEEITQGSKLELHEILHTLNDALALIEAKRIELLNECKGEYAKLEKGSPEYEKFSALFIQMSQQKIQVTIQPVNIESSKIKNIISEFDYFESIQLLFE